MLPWVDQSSSPRCVVGLLGDLLDAVHLAKGGILHHRGEPRLQGVRRSRALDVRSLWFALTKTNAHHGADCRAVFFLVRASLETPTSASLETPTSGQEFRIPFKCAVRDAMTYRSLFTYFHFEDLGSSRPR